MSELRTLWQLDPPAKRVDDSAQTPQSATRPRLWAIGAVAAMLLLATLASLRYFATSTSPSPEQAQPEPPVAAPMTAPEPEASAPIEKTEEAPAVEAPSTSTPPTQPMRDTSAPRQAPSKAESRAPADSAPPPSVCTELLQRASVGETLTAAEIETLTKSCK